MRTTKITAKEIMSWRPCPDWPLERVEAYVGKGMTPDEFLASDLSPIDLEWVLVRRQVLSSSELSAIVEHCPAQKAQEAFTSAPLGMDPGLGMPTALGLETEVSLAAPVDPLQVDLVALALWPDPMGAIVRIKRASPTLALQALRAVCP